MLAEQALPQCTWCGIECRIAGLTWRAVCHALVIRCRARLFACAARRIEGAARTGVPVHAESIVQKYKPFILLALLLPTPTGKT